MGIAVYNLSKRELEDDKKIGAIARTVGKVILSIPRTGLTGKDISPFTLHRNSLRDSEKVLVIITEASFFTGKVNSRVRQILRRRVRETLAPVLQRKVDEISVEIKRLEQ